MVAWYPKRLLLQHPTQLLVKPLHVGTRLSPLIKERFGPGPHNCLFIGDPSTGNHVDATSQRLDQGLLPFLVCAQSLVLVGLRVDATNNE
jgi:hypothetical protein